MLALSFLSLASRTLRGLALGERVPRVFLQLNLFRVPWLRCSLLCLMDIP